MTNPETRPHDGLAAELAALPELSSGMIANFTPGLRARILAALSAGEAATITTLRAERDALREALDKIRDETNSYEEDRPHIGNCACNGCLSFDQIERVNEIARAALTGGQDGR